MDKIILHVDMDAFFAAVEQLDNPKLRGKPVIVGGVSERGIVATCSYEARKYGIHSAMPIFIAQKLCPNGNYVKVRMSRYKEISSKIFEILREVTPLVEPLSIDEAYLDLSKSEFKDGMEAALFVKRMVYKKLGLTISVGISYNKFLAKLASDWNKPNGIMVINKNMVPDILLPLSISKIHGLGQKSVKKLNNMGIFLVEDLYEMPKSFYIEYLGKWGVEVYDRIRGIDKREVTIEKDRKSYGKERTLKVDIEDKEEVLFHIKEFCIQISNDLVMRNLEGRTITVKYKSSSFESHTRSKTLNYYTNKIEEFYKVCEEIIEGEDFTQGIRLIGLTISSFKENTVEQLTLF